MATYQDMLDAVGLILGGTQAVDGNGGLIAHFYSGVKAADGTGLTGIQGCWSSPPNVPMDTPVALLLPGPFKVEGPEHPEIFIPGNEWNADTIRLQILVSNQDLPTSWALLAPFRDSVATLFNSHMRLSSTAWPVLSDGSAFPFTLTAKVVDGHPGLIPYAETEYVGWEMTLRVWRMLQPIYTP